MKTTVREQTPDRGVAAIELTLVLPLLLVLVFYLIDFGMLIHANMVVTNVSREGGSLVSRGINSGEEFMKMLRASGAPLDLGALGRIHVNRIVAGASEDDPEPRIDPSRYLTSGGLGVSSAIGGGKPRLGLTTELYEHLRFTGPPQNSSDIAEVWVVEVYYVYKPITPISSLMQGLFLSPGHPGKIVGSVSTF